MARAIAASALLASAAEAAPRSPPSRSSSVGTVSRVNNVDYLDSADIARRFGLKTAWTKAGLQLVLSNATWRVEIEKDSREFRINGVRAFLGEPVLGAKRSLRMSRIDVERFLAPILSPGHGQAAIPQLKIIAIDAGHGGKDPGMQNRALKLNEKTCTLDTALRLKKILEARGYRTVLTRSDDRYVELGQRAELASKAGADLFISIHFNAVEKDTGRVSGTETYLMTPQYQRSTGDNSREAIDAVANPGNAYDHWNAVLGYHMHRTLVNDLSTSDRGLKRGRLAVLRLAMSPAVLVEAGYMSNETEAKKIGTPAYRQEIAESIARGVAAYAEALSKARTR